MLVSISGVGLVAPDKKEPCLLFAAAPDTPGDGSFKLSVAGNTSVNSKLQSNSLRRSVISIAGKSAGTSAVTS